MSKHTPGPWIFCGTHVDDSHGLPLVRDMRTWDKVNCYDHRLIAAAPDLLAVCQELEASASYWSEYDVPLGIVDRLRAAIAKATGATP